uniref:Aromatic amino acid beta-eliminating lyase/threonine aldolase domain-containing protein n=1 Tax=Panagrolaimus superbus TaxID=310955 RepID=A0A914YDG7_9BILA
MYPNKIGVKNSTGCLDLRSDTVTRASPEMRRAMAEAEVGDDVYEEDPTVNSLEERCAKLFGKESAIFVTTGTMGNLLAIMAHTMGRGEVIVGRTSHIHRWEVGGYARIAGVCATTLPINHDGTISLDSIEECLCIGDNHRPQTKLICLENTHNFVGGKALPLDYISKVRKLADPYNVKIHIDGARIYNAAIKHNISVAEIVKDADSIQMCFSKGLGAPIGSILVGSKEFIDQARLDRKLLGGGWRQAGHLAAAAHYALDHAMEIVTKDHERAEKLAKSIKAFNSSKIKVDDLNMTNMVIVTVDDPEAAVATLQKHGVLAIHFDKNRIRAVLHKDIDDEGVEKAISAFRALV